MQDTIVEARHIYKSYARKTALQDVSLSVPRASIYGLLGPNGAGKTTFIRILTQIIAPDSGEILLNGQPLNRDDITRIGYMPEERGLYRKMKVGEQMLYLARLKGLSKSQAMDAIKYWFTVFEIKDWWNKKVEELSKGMQQKVQFISTVIHKPQLIILDEPFTGFDPVNSEIIRDEILKLKEDGATIILSTHRMESVEELCDNLSLIHHSHKIIEGSVREVQHKFKEHIFEMCISEINGDLPMLNDPSFEVETLEKQKDGSLHLKFKLSEDMTPNRVLEQFLPLGTIISFKEVLPSINDIFISLVKGS